jgi:hypothetical protein
MCEIGADFYGTGGGAACFRNVNGSYTDFEAFRTAGDRALACRRPTATGAAAPRPTGRGGWRQARASIPRPSDWSTSPEVLDRIYQR